MNFLLLSSIAALLVINVLAESSELKWIDMDDHEIALWYNQFDQCMLSQGRLDSFNPQKSYNYCYKKYYKSSSNSWNDGVCSVTYRCKFAPSKLYQRIDGYGMNDASLKLVLEFLLYLYQTNRELVLIGDSITRQTMAGLACELWRELSSIIIEPAIGKLKFADVKYTIKIPISEITNNHHHYNHHHKFLDKDIVVSDDGIQYLSLPVTLFNIWEPFADQQMKWLKVKMNNMFRKKKKNVVIVFNIGLHESDVLSYQSHLKAAFDWAQSIRLLNDINQNNSFYFRETAIQHFAGSNYGAFKKGMIRHWEANIKRNYPQCDALNESLHTVNKKFWRSIAEESALKHANQNKGYSKDDKLYINRISFRSLTYSLHDIKPSSPLSLSRYERKFFDCTHFCGDYFPSAWYPLFYQLVKYEASHILSS